MGNPPPAAGTGILLLNLGGPRTLDDVEPFLTELFRDRELMHLPFQHTMGGWLAKWRTRKVRPQYEAIGGGSPLLVFTQRQASGLVDRLDRLSPGTGPHMALPAFRYAGPGAAQALRQFEAAGVKHVVAFSQYPHWSCSTIGSSLNDLFRNAVQTGLHSRFSWSVIDRWPLHPGFVASVADTIEEALRRFPVGVRNDVLLLFSAHSLPLAVVDRGDPYPHEVAATVHAVMQELGHSHRFALAWQSAVGPLRWLGPDTEHVIRTLGARGERYVMTIPVAFTSDHIETLFELDRTYAAAAAAAGIRQYERAPALNSRPRFLDALADIVLEHLRSGDAHSAQYALPCVRCPKPTCRPIFARHTERHLSLVSQG
jgi:ferrochelatase